MVREGTGRMKELQQTPPLISLPLNASLQSLLSPLFSITVIIMMMICCSEIIITRSYTAAAVVPFCCCNHNCCPIIIIIMQREFRSSPSLWTPSSPHRFTSAAFEGIVCVAAETTMLSILCSTQVTLYSGHVTLQQGSSNSVKGTDNVRNLTETCTLYSFRQMLSLYLLLVASFAGPASGIR